MKTLQQHSSFIYIKKKKQAKRRNTHQYAQAELPRHDFNIVRKVAACYVRVVAVDSAGDGFLDFKSDGRLFEKRGEILLRIALEGVAVMEVVESMVIEKFLEPAQGCFVA